jgi:hypothetical protein
MGAAHALRPVNGRTLAAMAVRRTCSWEAAATWRYVGGVTMDVGYFPLYFDLVWRGLFWPAVSLATCVAALSGMWFAVRPLTVPTRVVSVLVSLSCAVAAAYPFNFYAVAVADVGAVTVWLLGRYAGATLVKLGECHAPPSRANVLRPGQFTMSFVVLWLPCALGYLLATRSLCEQHPWDVTDFVPLRSAVVPHLVASIVLAAAFVGITWLNLRASSPPLWSAIVLLLVAPVVLYVAAWQAPTYFDDDKFAGYALLSLSCDIPLLTLLLLCLRKAGYRLTRESPP